MWKFFCTFAAFNFWTMQKEKTVRTYQRRTKTGKVVTVHKHTAKYDAAEAQREAAKKKGAGEELSAKKASKPQVSATPDYGFTAEEYKSWYHWDTENDPKNKAALKVEKALKGKLGAKGYKKYFDDMTDGYSARGHNKAFGGLGDYFKGSTSAGKPAKTAKPAKESREDATKRFMASPTPQKGEEGYAIHKALRGALRQGCGDDGTRDLLVRYGYPKDKAYSKGIEEVVSLAKKHGIDISLHGGSKRKGAEAPKNNEASAIRRYAKDEDIPLKTAYTEWKGMSSAEREQIKRNQAAWDSKQQKQKERRMRVSGNGKSVKSGLSKGKVLYGDEAANAKKTLLGEGYKQKRVTYEITRNLPVYGKKTWKTTVTALVSPDGKKAYKYEGSGNTASLTGSDKEFNAAWSQQSK